MRCSKQQYGAATAESQSAEVIYFLSQPAGSPIMDATLATPTLLYTLYRRVLLVSPSLTGLAVTDDVSQRVGASGQIGNTLGDLTKRENRFNHATAAFPFLMTLPIAPLSGVRLGDDVILTNVISLDVQAFDPGAPIYLSTSTPVVALEPRDFGFASATGAPTTYGAYADIGWTPPSGFTASPGNPPLFNGAPSTRSGITARPYIYDTWSLHYENDGVLQLSPTGIADAGTNGLDDDTNGIVDDLPEYDTLPPYQAKLRGVRITVRVYEPSSQQVREITVIQDFLPE